MSETHETAPTSGAPVACSAVKPDGSPCRAYATSTPDSPPFCLWHDPSREDEANAARERGRAAQRKPVLSLDDLEPALSESPDLECNLDALGYYLAWCVRQCTGGRMDPERLRSVVQGITALRTALTAKALAAEVRKAQVEIRRLRKELAEREKAKETWQR